MLKFAPPHYKPLPLLQLVLDAPGNGSAGVGQPQVLLPDGRIRFNG